MDGYDSCYECDDGEATIYPGAPEVNDGLDNQCPIDLGYGQTDEIEGSLVVMADEVCWNAQGGASGYELIRSAEPSFSSCTSMTTSSTCSNDPVTLMPGEVAYYLVRPNAPFVGDWGFDSMGMPRLPACAP